MHAALATQPNTPYRDRKRHAWLLSLLVPSTVLVGPAAMVWSGNALALWAPVLFFYGVVPAIDYFMGEDQSNPPEEAVPALEADRYYRWITYLLAPVLWAAFIFSAWFAASHDLPLHGWLAMVMISGAVGGFCINLGHELGHKNTALEKALAKIVLAPSGYGHFFVEHNRGHHRDAATPLDPASSRMGESIYRFVLREMPGAWTRAWALERSRLAQAGLPLWSWHNHILQPGVLTLGLWAALMAWLGPQIILFLVPAALWSNFQLTSANYVEHYGLLRQKTPQGRYESCQPHHSWNSNHIFSNWILFQLQRHSDHHAHPLRRYQSLRHFEDLPTLPSGYFGMFVLAYIPPLWYRAMDERLLAQVGRDTAHINLEPARRAALIARYGLHDSAAAPAAG
jgi:alkane 1-monooxygenase